MDLPFPPGDEGDGFKLDELKGSAAQLLGRRTYEAFARAWPTMEDPVGFADLMNAMPKYVVSTTLRDGTPPGTTPPSSGATWSARSPH